MKKRFMNLTLAMLFGVTALVGCGARSMPTAPDEEETPAPVATATPTPEPQVTPTPAPTVAPITARLSANVTSKKNGFMGAGAFLVTVDVGNDSSDMLSGELKVQFTNGSKADAAHLKTLQVTLQGGEHQSFSFEDKSWGIDDVKVEVVTQVSSQYAQSGYGAQYGQYNYSY